MSPTCHRPFGRWKWRWEQQMRCWRGRSAWEKDGRVWLGSDCTRLDWIPLHSIPLPRLSTSSISSRKKTRLWTVPNTSEKKQMYESRMKSRPCARRSPFSGSRAQWKLLRKLDAKHSHASVLIEPSGRRKVERCLTCSPREPPTASSRTSAPLGADSADRRR